MRTLQDCTLNQGPKAHKNTENQAPAPHSIHSRFQVQHFCLGINGFDHWIGMFSFTAIIALEQVLPWPNTWALPTRIRIQGMPLYYPSSPVFLEIISSKTPRNVGV